MAAYGRWFVKSGDRTWDRHRVSRGCKTKNNKLCKDYEGFKASEKTVTYTHWLLLFYPSPSKTRASFISCQHRSFTAAVSRLRKANVYVDDRVVGWIPQKTAKHFGTSLVTLLCKK